jgi:hypothetical protein
MSEGGITERFEPRSSTKADIMVVSPLIPTVLGFERWDKKQSERRI